MTTPRKPHLVRGMESQGGNIASTPGMDDFEIVAHDTVPLQPLPSRPSIEKRRAAIQRWLQPTDYLSPGNELMKHVHSHVPGTGSWVHEVPAFQTWAGSVASSCLAIKGVAGSGKSVLAASTIRQLQQSEPDVPVLFFFFRQIVEKNHSAKYLVRDFASQLLPWSDMLLSKLEVLSKSCGVDGSEHDVLWDALIEAMRCTHKVYCVADALDEMDDEDFDMISRLCSIGNHQDSKTKVLLTCRPIPKIEDAVRGLAVPQLRLEPSLIYPDVAKYVSVSMATLETTLSPEKEDMVKQTICERAQGLFLHARLMTDNLADGLQKGRIVEQTLPDSLERLPRNLREVYDAMLMEHAKRSGVSREEQARILMCVTHSTRPLRLIELGSLIARMKGTDNLKEGKALVKASCGRLLEILEDGIPSSSFPVLNATSAHAMLVELSLQYLDACPLLDISLDDPYQRRKPIPPTKTGSQSDSDGSGPCSPYDRSDDEYGDLDARNIKLKQRKELLEDMTLDQPLITNEERIFVSLDTYLRPGKSAFALRAIKLRPHGFYRHSTSTGSAFSIVHLAAIEGLSQYVLHLSQIKGIQLDEPDGDGRTPLSYAAEHGHVQIVSHLLEQGVNPELVDEKGMSPLHHSSSERHFEISKLLLEAGVNECFHWARGVEAVEAVLETGKVDVDCFSRGKTKLFEAADQCDYRLVEVLLARGADPNKRCRGGRNCTPDYDLDGPNETITLTINAPEGLTPMHAFARSVVRGGARGVMGREANESLALLISHGGQINMKAGEDRETPLHYTVKSPCSWGDERRGPSADMLLSAGADPNARNVRGETPLHCANPGSPDLIDVLARHGAVVDAVDDFGFTPLLTLMSIEDFGRAKPDMKAIEKLIGYGADVNKATNKGNTVMHMVMMNLDNYSTDDIPDLLGLLRAGSNLSKKNHDGLVPLLTYRVQEWSSRPSRFNTAILESFIGEGMDINTCDGSGETILWKIVSSFDGNNALMKQLIGLGADPRVRRPDGASLLHEAVKRGCGLNWIRFLISYGMNPSTADPEGNSLIHLAFEASRRKNPKEAMEYVLSIAKLDIPPTDRNAKGQSVLHLASAEFIEDSNYERGQEHWIDFVLKSPVFACIDINEKDKEGATPLHVAASCSEFNVARLLRAGADPTLLINEGMSALHVACLARQPGTVGLLLSEYKKRGILDQHINLCMTDARQRSPLHYACRSGHPESIRYLLANGADATQCDCDGFTPLHALAEFPQEQELWRSGGIDNRGMTSFQEDSRPTLENWNIFRSNRAAEIVCLLDEAGADLEAKTRKGDSPVTPMDLAIETGLQTMAAELVRCGITPRQGIDVQLSHEKRMRNTVQDLTSITDPENIITAVQTHLKDGNIDAVEQLFSNCSDGDGMTLCRFRPQYFHAMVRNGHTRLLERFKEEAYQVDQSPSMEKENVKDEYSPCIERDEPFTLLASACGCREPNLHVIKTLIEVVGVDVNAVSNRLDNRSKTDWATALHVLACGSYFWQIEALEYLLKQGADMFVRNAMGQTPLIAAVSSDYPNGFWKEHTIQILLERGSDPMAVDDRSMTCLEHVDDSKIARLLIQHGADILHVGVFSNALSRAVNRMDPLLVELFIENGVDVRNLKLDEYYGQNNILQVAAKRRYDMGIGAADWEARQVSVIKLLLSRGADPFLAYSDSTTILQAVIERHGIVSPFFELDGLDMERRGRDERTLLVSACVPSVPESPYEDEEPVSVHWEAAFLALERGADPNARDALGRTALHWLCTMKVPFDDSHEKLMAALIDAGPSVVHRHDKAGATPLHLALQSFQASAIHALIERGARAAEPDPQGDTALHHCAGNMTGRKHIASPASDLFRLFLDKGLNINARNGRGETPLHTFMASGWGVEERRRQLRPVSVSMGSREKEDYDVDGESDEKGVIMHTNATVLAVFHDAQADWFCVDDEDGSSLLHVIASRKGQSPGWDIDELVDTFKMLLRDVGLDPRLEDKRLRTPVDMAVARERWDIVNLFGEGAEGKGDSFISGSDFGSDDE
ncbi:hypothetical protein PG989_015807 [Apiospora arundinis]